MLECCTSVTRDEHADCIMEPGFSIKQAKRELPDTDYDDCPICQKGADSHSCPMITDQGYHSVIRAIAIIKNKVSP